MIGKGWSKLVASWWSSFSSLFLQFRYHLRPLGRCVGVRMLKCFWQRIPDGPEDCLQFLSQLWNGRRSTWSSSSVTCSRGEHRCRVSP